MLKKLGSKLKEQKGFTLIELLAVIVILGIIAAIAIPAISNVISKSETKSNAQEGVQIINAAKMFVANESSAEIPWNNGGDANKAELSDDLLEEYLDHVKSKEDFSVIVTRSSSTTSGKYTYELSGDHEAITSGTEISEQALINAAQ